MDFCRQFDSQRLHDCNGGFECGIAVFTEGPIELFARQAGLAGDLGHSLYKTSTARCNKAGSTYRFSMPARKPASRLSLPQPFRDIGVDRGNLLLRQTQAELGAAPDNISRRSRPFPLDQIVDFGLGECRAEIPAKVGERLGFAQDHPRLRSVMAGQTCRMLAREKRPGPAEFGNERSKSIDWK